MPLLHPEGRRPEWILWGVLKVALSLAHRVYLMGKAHVGFNGTVEELKENRAIRERFLEV